MPSVTVGKGDPNKLRAGCPRRPSVCQPAGKHTRRNTLTLLPVFPNSPRNARCDGRPRPQRKCQRLKTWRKSARARVTGRGEAAFLPEVVRPEREKTPLLLKIPVCLPLCFEHGPKIKSEHPGLSLRDTAEKTGSEQSAKGKRAQEQGAAVPRENCGEDTGAHRAWGPG